MKTKGTWVLRSESDPRWNITGRDDVGMFSVPKGCEDRIKHLTATLGHPPVDLTWSYMKD